MNPSLRRPLHHRPGPKYKLLRKKVIGLEEINDMGHLKELLLAYFMLAIERDRASIAELRAANTINIDAATGISNMPNVLKGSRTGRILSSCAREIEDRG